MQPEMESFNRTQKVTNTRVLAAALVNCNTVRMVA